GLTSFCRSQAEFELAHTRSQLLQSRAERSHLAGERTRNPSQLTIEPDIAGINVPPDCVERRSDSFQAQIEFLDVGIQAGSPANGCEEATQKRPLQNSIDQP